MMTIGSDIRRGAVVVSALFIACCAWAQTIGEVRRELARQRVPHAEIVPAQARLESGNFTSHRARKHHNILGIKHNGRYARYKRWQDCVSDYKRHISSRYQMGENYYAFLRRVGYAEDKKYERKVRKIVRTSKNKKHEGKIQNNW